MSLATTTNTTVPARMSVSSIEEGLDFTLSHFKPPYFPRRISTRVTALTGQWQTVVRSREEALAKYYESDGLDCRISAYPYPIPVTKGGINMQTTDIFLADQDMKDFKTKKSFDEAMQQTLRNFKDKLHGANPSVIWSGGGLHYLQPLDADIVLEFEKSVFSKFADLGPSRRLMQYAEMLVTDGYGDQRHQDSVSFNNCMFRIPWSYNSKYCTKNDIGEVVALTPQSQVKIVQPWDGYRPNIRYLLEDYWTYLIQIRNDEALERLRQEQKRIRFEIRYPDRYQRQRPNKMDWIESLYRLALDDFREYCTTFILVPYFVNIRRLSLSETSDLVMDWLDRCRSKKRLNWDTRRKVKDVLHRVGRYQPRTPTTIRQENPPLYARLQREGIIQ
jgi:hypothetical protein